MKLLPAASFTAAVVGLLGTVSGMTVSRLDPTVFTRDTGKPQIQTVTFHTEAGDYVLNLESPAPGSDLAVTSAHVWLDGELLAGPDDFKKSGTSFTFTRSGEGNHCLEVELDGKPGSTLVAEVHQELAVHGWREVTPSPKPSARRGHRMTYDSTRERVVLFGGWAPGTLADTWEWDGTAWTLIAPAHSPPARAGHSMAFDAARGRTVLFGGLTASGDSSDTWTWDGSDWTQKNPSTSPSVRRGAAMAYDPVRQVVVLYSGYHDDGTFLSDTWEWDGDQWTLRSPAGGSPPARNAAAMAYDSIGGGVLLFGGEPSVGSRLADTWSWDGTTWSQLSPSQSPPGRLQHTLVQSGSTGKLLVLGGQANPDEGNLPWHDCWEWDGLNWTPMPLPIPGRRTDCSAAYDAKRKQVVLFGGNPGGDNFLGDMWLY